MMAVSTATTSMAMPPPLPPPPSSSSSQDFELEQFNRIINFRDLVFAGKHADIKPPPSFRLAAANSTTTTMTTATPPTPITDRESAKLIAHAAADTPTSNARETAFNPVLLEKSDDLIRAEIQLQRKRLERAIRDQVEDRRTTTTKSSSNAEPFLDFDLPDVLSKALALVQATTATAAATATTSNHHHANEIANHDSAAASDSFDENSFYSSHHDTPDSRRTTRTAAGHDDVNTSTAAIPQETSTQSQSNTVPGLPAQILGLGAVRDYQSAPSTGVLITSSSTTQQQQQHQQQQKHVADPQYSFNNIASKPPHLSQHVGPSGMPAAEAHQNSHSDIAPAVVAAPVAVAAAAAASMADSSRKTPPPTTFQPSHTSLPKPTPTTTTTDKQEESRLSRQHHHHHHQTSVQVDLSRNDLNSANSSPTSSSQGNTSRLSGRKPTKKNKRKLDRPRAAVSPVIKAEPLSPSPVIATPYLRPNKRQKHSQREHNLPAKPVYQQQQQQHQHHYPSSAATAAAAPFEIDDPDHLHHNHMSSRGYAGQNSHYAMDVGYAQTRDSPQALYPAVHYQPHPHSHRYTVDDSGDRRLPASQYLVRRSPSPPPVHVYANYNPGMEVQFARPPSHLATDRSSRGEPTAHYYRDYVDTTGRMSVRPGASMRSSTMAPPKITQRIVVDAMGREYLEPLPPTTIVRQSAVPPSFRVENMLGPPAYERASTRAVSRHPAASEVFVQDDAGYPNSPVFSMPRRVFTQPHPVSVAEQRMYTPRDPSVRPMAPPSTDDFNVPTRHVPERRWIEDAPRDYAASAYRSGSIQPPPSQSVSYEAAREFKRYQPEQDMSVHPQAMLAGPDILRQSVQPFSAREYIARPSADHHHHHHAPLPREYSVVPADQYYHHAASLRGGGHERIAYVGGGQPAPPLPHEHVYGERPMREPHV